ncbi:hypothetical protein Q31a_26180 [Aureliella helgolandensis]|uniref:Uncharacterized protein n=1 Tax=Aureliella helgolandensis TaxID=2527968 RepID=A0A518G6T5_9BACT|nr:hypothetical protein Q31a_26180 [Aureliella helgolandensis]
MVTPIFHWQDCELPWGVKTDNGRTLITAKRRELPRQQRAAGLQSSTQRGHGLWPAAPAATLGCPPHPTQVRQAVPPRLSHISHMQGCQTMDSRSAIVSAAEIASI